MNPSIEYRLKLAKGFLNEAEQDMALKQWRSCVANAQLAVENALKAVIAVFMPVPRAHDPARLLLKLIEQEQIPENQRSEIESLAKEGLLFGPEVHIQTDYGDEFGGLTPWELFTEDDAKEAFERAKNIVYKAIEIVKRHEEAL